MVAASKSSLRRRPRSRADEIADSTRSGLVTDEKLPPAPQTYSKRSRVSSISDREHLKKRRRLSTDPRPPQLKIPVRSKVLLKSVTPKTVTQAVLTRADVLREDSGSDSPNKPEYDRIKKIEEKARAFIHEGGSHIIAQDEKRSLRSKDGKSRAKTQLAEYFPDNYDELMSLQPPNPNVLTPNARIILIDDVPEFQPPRARLTTSEGSSADPFDALRPLHNAQRIDLPNIVTSSRRLSKDPLDPEMYQKAHRRPERQEKQARNTERDKATHEKVQLDRILEELRGPDWLRVLGISGITETEKKLYEPKRLLFVREVSKLIQKWIRYKEKEKKKKADRLEALRAAEEELKDEPDDGEDEDVEEEQVEEEDEDGSSAISPGADAPPSANDLDALAARQLLQEAKSATSRGKKPTAILPPPLVVPEAHSPFTSFYSKRHLRDAAVAGHRRSRTLTAFGELVPEMEDVEFELPDSILTEDAIRACQRRRRRTRRGSPAE